MKKSKTMNEREVMKHYNTYLKTLVKHWHNDTTYDSELTQVCRVLLGNKCVGIVAVDRIPRLKKGYCCIFNLDKHNEPGSHWCAMYQDTETWIYDSFGRKVLRGKGIRHSDLDVEQRDAEMNCGQRCIAWLICVYNLGIENAIQI